MPLAWGGALSHTPVIYRPRSQWPAIKTLLTGSVPQPAVAKDETAEQLADLEKSLDASFRSMRESMSKARLDALVVLVADRARFFDDANTPQIHVFAGDEIWGDTACAETGEASRIRKIACDARTGAHLIEELFDAGFDIAESHGEFRPVGNRDLGAVAALLDPIDRLDCPVPVVPIHLNCHTAPALRGSRVSDFGTALGAAIQRSPKRIGVLASGGMSGDPGGYLAGWIDPTLDHWVLRQLETGRSARLAPIFDVESNALRGNSAELRLWLAAAMESQRGVARPISYHSIHAAVAGTGFFMWEMPSCP